MAKYSKKKHLSLEINKNENWAKYNHKQNRTYKNVDANWKEQLDVMSAKEKQQLFFKYAFEGNKKMLKAIYNSDGEQVDINAFDKDNNNALMYALKSGVDEAIEYLVEIGINCNYINSNGFSPLHFAVRKNNLDYVALLIDNGADINIKDNLKQTAIFDAVCENNAQMVSALIMNGVAVDSRNKHGVTLLMIAVEDKRRFDALMQLIASGADINASDNNGKNALVRAIEHQNNPMMDILIKNGIDINAKDRRLMTPIMHCAKMGNREALRILISKGGNVFEVDSQGRTALDIAEHYNHNGCMEILAKAEKIYCSENLSTEDKILAIKEFGKHNKVANSCAR